MSEPTFSKCKIKNCRLAGIVGWLELQARKAEWLELQAGWNRRIKN